MITVLVVLAALWLVAVLIDAYGPVGVFLVVLGVVAALTMAGCATVPAPPTPEPPSLVELRQAMARIVAYCNQDGPRCTAPTVQVVSDRLNQYLPAYHVIRISQYTLEGGDIGRAIMAHELSHAWFADSLTLPHKTALGCDATDQVRCERNANYHAPGLLVVGWGMSEEDALNAVWHMLLQHTLNPAEPTFPAHPDWCAELHDFERRYQAVQETACIEK